MKKRPERESPLRLAAFTVVRNEPIFLPLWLKYYSRIADTIHVFDHFTEDGSVVEAEKHYDFAVFEFDDSDIEIHKWEGPSLIIKGHFATLVDSGKFDYVIYTDVDEFIVPDPSLYVDLRHYIEEMADETPPKNYAWCKGWEIVHDIANEPAMDFSQPILAQRKFMKESHLYDKPLIGRVHMNWCRGQHYIQNVGKSIDKNLWLFHLHYADLDVCAQRYVRRFPGIDHRERAIGNINAHRIDAIPIQRRFKKVL